MSLHRSLKTEPSALNQHRNVLTRTERIVQLIDEARFDPETDPPVGLVKVANRKVTTGKKKKKEDEDGTTETEAAAAAPTT